MQTTSMENKGRMARIGQYLTWPVIQAVFILAYFLVAVYAYYHDLVATNLLRTFGFPLIAGFTAIALIQKNVRREWGVRLLLLFFVWVFFVEFTHRDPGSNAYEMTLYHVLMYGMICFPLAFVLSDAVRRNVMRFLLHGFVLVGLLLCLAGLYTALWQVVVDSPNSEIVSDAFLGLDVTFHNRLFLFMHPNRGGLLCTVTLLMAVYLALSTKHLAVRIYCIAAAVIIGITLPLMDSRTNMITISIGLGALAFLFAKDKLLGRPNVWRFLISLVSAAVAAAVCFAAFSLPVPLVGWAATQINSGAAVQEATTENEAEAVTPAPETQAEAGATATPEATGQARRPYSFVIASAQADEAQVEASPTPRVTLTPLSSPSPAPIIVVTEDGSQYTLDEPEEESEVHMTQSRDLLPSLAKMGGRVRIWNDVLSLLRDNPEILLTGVSAEKVLPRMSGRMSFAYGHLHNAFIEMLVALGIPGVLLMVAFLVLLAVRSVRLFFSGKEQASLADRFLPVILLACMVVAMLESIFFIMDQKIFDVMFFVVAGYVTHLSLACRAKTKKGVEA